MHVGSPGIVTKVYPYPGYCLCHTLAEGTEVPGLGMGILQTYINSGCGTEVLQNSQKFRVLWHGRTELTHFMKIIYPYPGYLWHWRAELKEVPGTGMNVIQNFQKFRVRV